jgi:hypothetical protein
MYASAALLSALSNLRNSISELEMVLNELRAQRDRLALHIFFGSRRAYRKVSETNSGKRHDMTARLSWQNACELGFRGKRGGVGTPNGDPCEVVNGGWLRRKG